MFFPKKSSVGYLSSLPKVFENGTILGVSGDFLSALSAMLNCSLVYVPLSLDGPWATKEGRETYYGKNIGFTYFNDIDIFIGAASGRGGGGGEGEEGRGWGRNYPTRQHDAC